MRIKKIISYFWGLFRKQTLEESEGKPFNNYVSEVSFSKHQIDIFMKEWFMKKDIEQGKCPVCFTDLIEESRCDEDGDCWEVMICPHLMIHDRENALLFVNKFIQKNGIDYSDKKIREKIFDLAIGENWDSLAKLGTL